jgi:hypothetical protein
MDFVDLHNENLSLRMKFDLEISRKKDESTSMQARAGHLDTMERNL